MFYIKATILSQLHAKFENFFVYIFLDIEILLFSDPYFPPVTLLKKKSVKDTKSNKK